VDLVAACENPLGEQKSSGKFEIMPRSPHSERDGFSANADFEWFFDGKEILNLAGRLIFNAPDRYRQDAAVHGL
jgi:hypothetical protein